MISTYPILFLIFLLCLEIIKGGFLINRYAVIYNLHSGHNNGESVGHKIEQAFVKKQHQVELMPTKGPKDATRCAGRL